MPIKKTWITALILFVFFLSPGSSNAQVLSSSNSDDSLIKARLLSLALNNPDVTVADADIKIAEYQLQKAKSSWLGSLSATGNVNEFVVNGSSAANYYPKYNFGVSIPFDIFSKTKNEKKTASQNIVIARSQKEDRLRAIKREVLTRYENYKEKKELLRLQKISTEEDNETYKAAQKNYADGTIQLVELNRTYQMYINSQAKVVSSERDYNVTIIELEELIGVSLDVVLQ